MPNADLTDPAPAPAAETGDDERADAHLEDVEVGAGCTEIWEHLADERERAADD